jgi:hypothetical protein
MEQKPPGLFTRRPWLFVVMAFALLIAAWAAMVTIAVKNGQEKVPVPKKAKY